MLETPAFPAVVCVSATSTAADSRTAMLALAALIEARGSSVARVSLPTVSSSSAGQSLRTIVAQTREATEEVSVVVIQGPAAVGLPIAANDNTLLDLAATLRYLGISSGVTLVSGYSLDDANVMRLVNQCFSVREVPLLGVIFDDRLAGESNDGAQDEVMAACTAPKWGALPARRPAAAETRTADLATWFDIL